MTDRQRLLENAKPETSNLKPPMRQDTPLSSRPEPAGRHLSMADHQAQGQDIYDPQDLEQVAALNQELPKHLIYTPSPPQETEDEFLAKQAAKRRNFAKEEVKAVAGARLEAKLEAKLASTAAVSNLAAETRQAVLGNISSLEELDLKEALLKTYIDLVESFQMNLEAPLNHKATALTSRTAILKAIYGIKHKLDAQERVTIQEGVLIEVLEELDADLKQKFLRIYRQRLEQAEKTKKRGAYGN